MICEYMDWKPTKDEVNDKQIQLTNNNTYITTNTNTKIATTLNIKQLLQLLYI